MNHFNKRPTVKHKRLAFKAALISTLIVLPSCKIPVLCRPDNAKPLPETFNGRSSTESSAQVDLFQFFNDPLLSNLVVDAFNDNQQLKILAQDINIARNEVYERRGAYLPFLSFGARAGAEKPGDYTVDGAVENNLLANGKPFPDPMPDFLIATDVTWEIDVWKRLRNAQSAAALRYLGTADGRNYVITRLTADIADNYYELLALDKRLNTLDRTISLQEQSLDVAKANKQFARGTELAVQRFQAEVRKNQSEKLVIAQDIVEAENRINFLAGRFPQAVERGNIEFFDLTLPMLEVGVPAQLLQNRADIRQAEKNVAAAGLEVRVARARFFPAVNITAGVGYRAFDQGFLFRTPESLMYNAFGDIVAPVINRRAIKAAYLTANSEQLQAVYEYQRTVLEAFTEVINSLTKIENYGKSIEIKRQQLEALELSVESATKLFQNARAEYVEVLLAQRDLQDAKVVLIETKRQQLTAIVDAYQALGGGMLPVANIDPALLPPVPMPIGFEPAVLMQDTVAPVTVAPGTTVPAATPETVSPVQLTPEMNQQ